jgi:hypothetical protein
MRMSIQAFIVAALVSMPIVSTGQAATTAPDSAAATSSVASVLKGQLDGLQQSLTGLKMEKWKGGSIRTEAAANVASIQKDLQGTLPSLISAADAAPTSLSKALPVSRNLDALYDVLLRVVDGARVAAPGDQADQLMQAAAAVEKGRQALNDHLQQMADGAERQVVELRAAVVKAQAPAAAPAPPVCPATPAPAAKKKVVKKKPAPPPAATAPPAATKPAPQ